MEDIYKHNTNHVINWRKEFASWASGTIFQTQGFQPDLVRILIYFCTQMSGGIEYEY